MRLLRDIIKEILIDYQCKYTEDSKASIGFLVYLPRTILIYLHEKTGLQLIYRPIHWSGYQGGDYVELKYDHECKIVTDLLELLQDAERNNVKHIV